jgi:hypothetical protein
MVRKVFRADSKLDSIVGKTSSSGGNVIAYNRKTEQFEQINLELYNSIKLKLNGFVKVDERQYDGWSKKLPFYLYNCKVGGKQVYLLDYPHGNDRLDCAL